MTDWPAAAARHRAARDAAHAAHVAALAPLWSGIDGARKAAILEHDACGLLAAMRAGEVSSREATLVYAERTHHIGCGEINAVTEAFFVDALAAAEASDARRASGAAVGALEGLPITLKDCFDMEGTYSTVGFCSRVLQPGRHTAPDGLMTKILRDAGAVVLAKTNVPRGLLEGDTYNLLFGTTRNPWNLSRSPGGSSGGEGAMVAARCSALGFGTDIGGSVRMPSSNCGVYGFKCTARRLSTRGLSMQEGPGQETVLSMPGPIARSVDDCALAMRVWLCEEMWLGDPTYTPPVPWRDEAYCRPATGLKVALLLSGYPNTDWAAVPAMARALHLAADALRTAGATVVSWEPRVGLFGEMNALWMDAFAYTDELRWYKDALDGEAMAPAVASWLPVEPAPGGKDHINVLQAKRRLLAEEYTATL